MAKSSFSTPLLAHLNPAHINFQVAPEINHDDFSIKLQNIPEHERYQIEGACLRLSLVEDLHTARRTYNSFSNLDALEVYLLCTCLDVLSEKVDKQGHRKSVGCRIKELLYGLPDSILQVLLRSYVLVSESEKIVDWDQLPQEVKLKRIYDYLYLLRRNTFTHDALIVPTAHQTVGIAGLVCFIWPGIWNYSVYFNLHRSNVSEKVVLKTLVVGAIRKKLGLIVDVDWLDNYLEGNNNEMENSQMIATAWNNGKHHPSGAGYGLKLRAKDRDRHFQKGWKIVVLELQGNPAPVEVNVDKPSFWGSKCRELISKEIGLWLIENNLVPWPKGKPPKLLIEPIAGNRFSVRLADPNDQDL